jgi:amidase
MGDVHAIPVGISFMGTKNTDARILGYGFAYEQASGVRIAPRYLESAEARPEIRDAMIP